MSKARMKRGEKRQRETVDVVESVCIGPCARSGCDEECWIEIDTALTPLERSMELQSIVYCSKCYTESLTLQPPLSFFSCHLNGSVVHTSNHPEFLDRNNTFNASTTLASSKQDTKLVDDDYEQAAQWIRNAKHILVIAGAGMSADCFSGATFRGTGTMSKLGGNLAQEEIDYNNNPAAAWYYDWSIREWALNAEPHIGYSTLKELLCQSTYDTDRYFVITSNIDGMFLRSGFENVWETHGSTLFLQCFAEDTEQRCNGASSLFTLPKEMKISLNHDSCTAANLAQEAPLCPNCQGKTRFNISHLCDLPGDVEMHRKVEQEKKYRQWIEKVRSACNGSAKNASEQDQGEGESPYLAIIEVGCGASVHGLRPETSLLMSDHAQSGFGAHSRLIRINLVSPNAVTASTIGTDINTAWTGDGDDENDLPGKPGLARNINAGAAEALKKIQACYDSKEE